MTLSDGSAGVTSMPSEYCDCECMGCSHFHGSPEEGQDAHHARLLLALDRSLAAACRSRGIDACDGLNDDAPCEVGTLHTRAGELAVTLAAALENPRGTSAGDRAHFDRAHDALEALLLDLATAVGDRPKVS